MIFQYFNRIGRTLTRQSKLLKAQKLVEITSTHFNFEDNKLDHVTLKIILGKSKLNIAWTLMEMKM